MLEVPVPCIERHAENCRQDFIRKCMDRSRIGPIVFRGDYIFERNVCCPDGVVVRRGSESR